MKTKLKISKSQWQDIGKKAGWIKISATQKDVWHLVGKKSTCPICKKIVNILGFTPDNHLIGSCKDIFTYEQLQGIV